jgi:hypothetical protein
MAEAAPECAGVGGPQRVVLPFERQVRLPDLIGELIRRARARLVNGAGPRVGVSNQAGQELAFGREVAR